MKIPEQTLLGDVPKSVHGDPLMAKPSQLLSKNGFYVEYGLPWESDPTYICLAYVALGLHDLADDEELYHLAYDLVEQYAQEGYFGGFVAAEPDFDSPAGDFLSVWITSYNE